MQTRQLNLFSRRAVLGLSLLALATVSTGYFQRPQPDEGTAAHIFQLSVLLLAPMLALFLLTADWKHAWRNLRALRLPAAFLVVAFSALYYLEHYWYR